MASNQEQIFRKGSKTFFYSSFLFPKIIKKDVSILYAFVRIADDYVDAIPADLKSFYDFKNNYYQALVGQESNSNIIKDFISLQKKFDFEQGWVDAFLSAMERDLNPIMCKTIKDTENYMYGSAEVVGLMMCRILSINKEAYPYAQKLGQAFQYINFIRDVYEDEGLKRGYLPEDNVVKSGLGQLNKESAYKNKVSFEHFLRKEINYFYELTKEAKKGFKFIPIRYRVPIMLATNLYIYTAKIIEKDPLIVYTKKVKPGQTRILYEALKVLIKI